LRVIGAWFLGCRLVSLASGFLIAGMVGWLIWRRARSLCAAVLGSVLFVGLGLGGLVPWTAAYKEDLLGVAFAVGSLVALDGAPSRRRVVLGAVLAASAALTKQSLLGPAIAGCVWLLALRRVRRAALVA